MTRVKSFKEFVVQKYKLSVSEAGQIVIATHQHSIKAVNTRLGPKKRENRDD